MSFKRCTESDICVFGSDRVEHLIKNIISGYDYKIVDYIIYNDSKTFYINLHIVLYLITFLFKGIVPKKFSFKKKLYCGYLYGRIKYINPKIVISLMGQYSLWYGVLCNNLRNINFIGVPWTDIRQIYIKAMTPAKFSNYLFGKNELRLFHRYGHPTDNFKCVGSLLGGAYFSQHVRSNKSKYDICIISQIDNWVYHNKPIVDGYDTPRLFKAQELLCRYVSKYAKFNSKSICVALRPQSKSYPSNYEKNFYNNFLYGDVTYISYNAQNNSSYDATLKSRITVNVYSTLALDAMAAGLKVLFYDPFYSFGDKTSDLYWSLHNGSYISFKLIMDKLFNIQEKEYWELIKNDIESRNNIDLSKPLHLQVQKEIYNILNK